MSSIKILNTIANTTIAKNNKIIRVVSIIFSNFHSRLISSAKVQQKVRTHKGTDKWSDGFRQMVGKNDESSGKKTRCRTITRRFASVYR